MLKLNEQAQKWLKANSHKLPPEEIQFESFETLRSVHLYETYVWPTPVKIDNLGLFNNIDSAKEFNKVVGNPENWKFITTDIYNYWILPNAILLFGKTWFDNMKWKNTIYKNVDFPLFDAEEKSLAIKNRIQLEDTTSGKAIILKIISKVKYALSIYLEGKWLETSTFVKKPGGYIVDSLKNEFIRIIATDLGYKLSTVSACPLCLYNKNISKKTAVLNNGPNKYICPRCEYLSRSLEYSSENPDLLDKIHSINKFRNFIGVTCICPSNSCYGKFIPLSCVNTKSMTESEVDKKIMFIESVLEKLSIPKNNTHFLMPPEELFNLSIECPYCYIKFNLGNAVKSSTGFKNSSGLLTGLPNITIWKKRCVPTLDQNINEDGLSEISQKNNIVSTYVNPEEDIISKQKVDILIDEVIMKISTLPRDSYSNLLTIHFLEATIIWMYKYYNDAMKYFFIWENKERKLTAKESFLYPDGSVRRKTIVSRGQETSIHQSLFYTWLNILEENIGNLNKLNPKIKELKDLKLFCHEPEFIGGPESTFKSYVDFKLRIPNCADKQSIKKQRFVPRIAKVISLYKVRNGIISSINRVDNIKSLEWQCINVDDSFKKGDEVLVKVLLFPGHTTSGPIQRILRLRTKVFSQIVKRIQDEELTNNRDSDFWQDRKNVVLKAREITGITLMLKEKL